MNVELMFAKLYDTDKNGQILVKADMNEEGGPEIRFYFKPEELGVCSVAMAFNDNDKGWAEQERVFMEMTEEYASRIVAAAQSDMGIKSKGGRNIEGEEA